jgi:hypothetical protein
VKRFGTTHATAIAYVALFVALGGSGYAATTIASASRATPLKVRCSASQGRRRVACKVVKGSGQGPQGLRGAQGPPGPSGATGPTVLSQSPGYSYPPTTVSKFPWTNASGQSYDSDLEQEFTAYSQYSPEPLQTTTLQTALLSPSEVAGGAERLASVQFCYGVFNGTDPGQQYTSEIQITNAEVVEDDEQAPGSSAAPTSPNTNTTPEAPPYAPVPLINEPLSPALENSSGCRTVTASSPAAISASGYLSLVLTVTYQGEAYGGNYPEGTISLGRVTTTYSP